MDVFRLDGGGVLYVPLIADWENHAERQRLGATLAAAEPQDDAGFWTQEA